MPPPPVKKEGLQGVSWLGLKNQIWGLRNSFSLYYMLLNQVHLQVNHPVHEASGARASGWPETRSGDRMMTMEIFQEILRFLSKEMK